MALDPFISEEVVRRCSVKKCFYKFHKMHQKTPAPKLP